MAVPDETSRNAFHDLQVTKEAMHRLLATHGHRWNAPKRPLRKGKFRLSTAAIAVNQQPQPIGGRPHMAPSSPISIKLAVSV